MAGCDGPRFTTRFSVPLSGTPSPRKNSWVRRAGTAGTAGGVALVVSGVGVMRVLRASVSRPDERLPAADRVVLAQGVTLELLVEEQAPEIGMLREAEAEHVPHLALEPV